MRLLTISDIHIEFHKDGGTEFFKTVLEPHAKDVDAIVIAGDFDTSTIEQSLITTCNMFSNVLYVMGNHESYGTTLQGVRDRIHNAESKCSNLHFLDNKRIELMGQGFVGGTLWFPNLPRNMFYTKGMNDFNAIRLFDVYIADEECTKTKEALKLAQPNDIAITHHLPHPFSIAPEYIESKLNCFYLCNMNSFIERAKLKMWIHGHTHSFCDYEIHGTRILCNPFGYIMYDNSYVDPMIVEV